MTLHTDEPMGVLRAAGAGYAARLEREYPTTVADLWSALTEPDRLARWMDRVSGDLHPGGVVVVHFDDGEARMRIESCDPPRALVVAWEHETSSSTVRVTVEELGPERVRLVLDHDGLSSDALPMYGAGWHWHLGALGAVLAGREPEPWSTFDDLVTTYQASRDELLTSTTGS